jgi:hypothetical protein
MPRKPRWTSPRFDLTADRVDHQVVDAADLLSAQLLSSVCSAPRPLTGTRKWNGYSSSQVMTAPNPSVNAA